MIENKVIRLGQLSRKLNVGHNTIIEFLAGEGIEIKNNPNTKVTSTQFAMLSKEFASSASEKLEASGLSIGTKATKEISINLEDPHGRKKRGDNEEEILIKNVGSSEIKVKEDTPEPEVEADPKIEEEIVQKKNPEKSLPDVIKADSNKLKGLKIINKIDLSKEKIQPVASSDSQKEMQRKRPRKRIFSTKNNKFNPFSSRSEQKAPLTEKEIQDQIRTTLAKLGGTHKKTSSSKYRKEKRKAILGEETKQLAEDQEKSKILKVTEFISANNLASLLDVSVNDVISECLKLGIFVSINQRLDAETITLIADEFNHEVEFHSTLDDLFLEEDEEDSDEMLVRRAPIVTIMGHVDHGKTSLLDHIRETKITAQEAGGITQHIGAYKVTTKGNQKITFLDTPGHEAFTAMRARGAKLTDISIIVVAADDDVMPQTKEAINHAQTAGVPIIVAINKMDKSGANAEKIKESLSKINILVEDWGGKYQCQEISSKTGQGIDDLLSKVLLEAELLELKANPNRAGIGTVIEASLDKGRGYVATFMVKSGTLKIGNVVLAGFHYGRIKAMFDSTSHKVDEADPSTPVLVLGLNGAPQAGENFRVMKTDREAREIAAKHEQLIREQNLRTKKHITLDEIGRRLAIGSFKELKIIVKGDVDGSIEAISDSLLQLASSKIQLNIIHKGVGQISESDVLLASASDAIIVGFQVRPSGVAKKLAESEEIEIRLYSVIYDAIDDIKASMEGMLEKETEEVIVGNVEIREIFKVSKVGIIAGAMVVNGYIKNKNPIRIVRDGIVIYAGEIDSLKRFKENVTEVKMGFECGISIKSFNDITIGDIIENFEVREVKK